MFERNRFWWWFGGTTAFAALHPLGVYLASPGEAGIVWIKNDPAMNAFAPCLLPWAVAIAASILVPDIEANFPREVRRTWQLIFGVLVAVAIFLIALPDLRRAPIEPYVFDNMKEAAETDQRQRDGVRAKYEYYENNPPADKAAVDAMHADLLGRSRAAVQTYIRDANARFTGFLNFVEHATFSGWTKFLMNCLVSIVVPFYFAFVVSVGYALLAGQPAKFNVDALLLALSLLILWFPVRLYTEWYLHFFTLSYLTDFPAFFVLLVVAILGLGWIVFIMKPSRAAVTIPTLVSVFTAVFGLLSVFKPGVLWLLARVFEKMPFQFVAALLAIGVVCTAVLVSALMRRRAAAMPLEPVNPS